MVETSMPMWALMFEATVGDRVSITMTGLGRGSRVDRPASAISVFARAQRSMTSSTSARTLLRVEVGLRVQLVQRFGVQHAGGQAI